MLTRVDVQSENPFYLNIRNAKPSDSIIVAKIEGLGPPDVNLFIGEYARDGGSYGGRRVPPRTVIFTLELNPDYTALETVDGLRELLYKAFFDPFATSDALQVILHDDMKADRYVEGYADKFDPDIFSDDTTVRIEMLCLNPFIQDVDVTSLDNAGPTLPFEYLGSAEAGFVVRAKLTSSSTRVTIDLNGQTMMFDYPFFNNDILVVDTRPGSRRVQLVRTVSSVTTTTDILYSLVNGSVWLKLHSLNNVIKSYGDDVDDVIANIDNISFRALHWGI